MSLWVPPGGLSYATPHVSTTAGTTITAHTSAHTVGDWIEVASSTAEDAYGIFLMIYGTSLASNATHSLMNIATGASESEAVLIPNLAAGWADGEGGRRGGGRCYFFPLYIKAGTRIAANLQSVVTGGKTAALVVWLLTRPINMHGRPWVGAKVTAYGAATAASAGTFITSGNGSYGTAVELSAATADPIKFMQFGVHGESDGGASNLRGMLSIRSTTQVLVEGIMLRSSTEEHSTFIDGNMTLAHMRFNVPAGISLRAAAMTNGGSNNVFDYIIYGVS